MYIYYHGDMDGIVSAHFYTSAFKVKSSTTIKTFEFEYSKEDAILDTLKVGSNNNTIVFVDCCPSEEILDKVIKKVGKVIILDHHISKKELIDSYINEGLVEGISYIGACAALITWCWFHFDKDIRKIIEFLDRFSKSKKNQDESIVPYSLRLVNSWDVWNGLYTEAEPFKIYFETQNFIPLDERIDEIMENPIKTGEAVRYGQIMQQFYHSWGNIYCERFGYEIQYKKNNFYVLNVGNANSKIFGDRIKDYDAVIIYCNNGIRYQCSIYSDKSEFNCAEFAEQFGGGGHKGAAGFILDELPIWLRDKKSGLVFKE